MTLTRSNYAEERLSRPVASGIAHVFCQRALTGWLLFFTGLIAPIALPWHQGGFMLAVLTALMLAIHRRTGVFFWLFAGALISGFAGLDWASRQLPEHCWRQPVSLQGTIDTIPDVRRLPARGESQQFEFEVDRILTRGCGDFHRLRLSYWQPKPALALGEHLLVSARLRPPPSQMSPAMIPDQVRYLSAGIDARGTVETLVPIAIDSLSPVNAIRTHLYQNIPRAGASDRSTGLLTALIVGEGGRLSQQDWDQFRRLGLSHVLVISGLHIGLVFALVQIALRSVSCLLPGGHCPKRYSLPIALSAALSYCLLAGFSIPTQRALIMLSALVIPVIGGWRTRGRYTLRLAVALILVSNPFAVVSQSLWMSGAATGILILLSNSRSSTTGVAGLLRLQTQLVLLMAPITLFWFGATSLVGVLSNLVIVPVLSLLVVPAALVGALWSLLAPDWVNLPWLLAGTVADWVLFVIHWLDMTLGSTGFVKQHLGLADAALLSLLLFSCLLCQSRVKKNLLSVAAAVWIGLLAVNGSVIPLRVSSSVSEAETGAVAVMTVFDVGQGLAVFWQEGDQSLLYDTGASYPGGYAQAERVLLPFLARERLGDLGLLVVSHGDTDHSGGLSVIRDQVGVGRHYGYGGTACRVGERLRWRGRTTVTVLSGPNAESSDPNGGSCVILLAFGEFRVLLAGDIPRAKERELVRYWREELRADVLLVAHHGSDTSSSQTFLKWVAPRYGIISASRTNPFGHPTDRVLSRLEAAGIQVFNTAREGAVTLRIDPSGEVDVDWARKGQIPYWLAAP